MIDLDTLTHEQKALLIDKLELKGPQGEKGEPGKDGSTIKSARYWNGEEVDIGTGDNSLIFGNVMNIDGKLELAPSAPPHSQLLDGTGGIGSLYVMVEDTKTHPLNSSKYVKLDPNNLYIRIRK